MESQTQETNEAKPKKPRAARVAEASKEVDELAAALPKDLINWEDSFKKHDHEENRRETKKKLLKIIAEEAEMVTGKFIFHECPGGSMNVFQMKYKQLPAFKRELVDGCTYTVPRWVARWLNGVDKSSAAYGGVINSGAKPVYQVDRTVSSLEQVGQAMQSIGSWKRRFSFQSMEFS